MNSQKRWPIYLQARVAHNCFICIFWFALTFKDNAFDTLDSNGDGQLSFEEFKEFALAEPKVIYLKQFNVLIHRLPLP